MNNKEGMGDDIYNTSSIQSLKRFQRKAIKCPNCNNLTYGYLDPQRDERICIACGFVQSPEHRVPSRKSDWPREKTKPHATKDVLIDKQEYKFLTNKEKYQRIQQLSQKYDPHTQKSTTAYRYEHYKSFAQVCKSNFQMTFNQLHYVYAILEYFQENKGIQQLHSRCKGEVIVLALCIFSMWRDWRKVDVENDPFCIEVGLTDRQYKIIVKNLLKIGGECKTIII